MVLVNYLWYVCSFFFSHCVPVGFCSVIFGWDLHDKVYSIRNEFASDDSQWFDFIAKVDLSSYRRIPWEDNMPFFLLYLYHPKTDKPLYCDPRSVLKDVCDSFHENYGLTPYSGVEFEFFCFKG